MQPSFLFERAARPPVHPAQGSNCPHTPHRGDKGHSRRCCLVTRLWHPHIHMTMKRGWKAAGPCIRHNLLPRGVIGRTERDGGLSASAPITILPLSPPPFFLSLDSPSVTLPPQAHVDVCTDFFFPCLWASPLIDVDRARLWLLLTGSPVICQLVCHPHPPLKPLRDRHQRPQIPITEKGKEWKCSGHVWEGGGAGVCAR